MLKGFGSKGLVSHMIHITYGILARFIGRQPPLRLDYEVYCPAG